MKIYSCYKCNFLFERVAEPEQCPDCGSWAVIAANEEQICQYRKYREEFVKGKANLRNNFVACLCFERDRNSTTDAKIIEIKQ